MPPCRVVQLRLRLSLSSGAGQEVGRSCIMLEFKNKKIMVRSCSFLSDVCKGRGEGSLP